MLLFNLFFAPVFDIELIAFLSCLGIVYLGMNIFNISSIIATSRLIKNKPITTFNKISFIGFILACIVVLKFVYSS